MKIFLIGMPGSGKSTIGRKIAQSLNIPFLDLDEIIERNEDMKIPQIFNTQGEAYFREQEDWLLKNTTMEHSEFVLATGGGTPCFFDNLSFMKKNGKVVFIDVPIKEIAKRLRKEGIVKRPLLQQKTSSEVLEEYLSMTFEKRKAFYQQADLTLTDSQPYEEIIEAIKS